MHGGQEPAIRQQLRAARAAEKHAKMKAALAEKQQKEAEETTRREQQQQHKQAHRERIDAWKNKNKVRTHGVSVSVDCTLRRGVFVYMSQAGYRVALNCVGVGVEGHKHLEYLPCTLVNELHF
jgi:hypothetical protein